MVIEAAIGAVAAESIAEVTIAEAAEVTVAESLSEVSGATELSETLSAIQKEVPREIINERVDAMIEANEVSQIEVNRIFGAEREEVVGGELAREYLTENGNHIARECYLRDAEGHVVKDQETKEARRIDFAVIKDGEVVKSVEVTSETADKTAQLAKEDRIREAGGNYIKDRLTGEIVPFAHGVKTEVVRRI